MLQELDEWMKKNDFYGGSRKMKGMHLNCDRLKNKRKWKKNDDRIRNKCYSSDRSIRRKPKMLSSLAICLARKPQKEKEEVGRNSMSVIPEGVMQVRMKIPKEEEENGLKRAGKGKEAENVRNVKPKKEQGNVEKIEIKIMDQIPIATNREVKRRKGKNRKSNRKRMMDYRRNKKVESSRKRRFQLANPIVIVENSKLLAEMKVEAEEVVEKEREESHPIPTGLVPARGRADLVPEANQNLDLAPDQNLVHAQDRGQNLDQDLNLVHVRDQDRNPGLVPVQDLNRARDHVQDPNRDRGQDRDRDQNRDQDQNRDRDQNQDRDQNLALDQNQDPSQGQGLNRGRGLKADRVREVAADRDRDRDHLHRKNLDLAAIDREDPVRRRVIRLGTVFSLHFFFFN